MNSSNLALWKVLIEWRNKELEKQEGKNNCFFGVQRIMSDNVCDHIVDLAHVSKLLSTQNLVNQKNWKDSIKYGEEILSIICIHAPQPTPQPTPQLQILLVNFNENLSETVRKDTLGPQMTQTIGTIIKLMLIR
jgi:hypothetical protein